MISYTYLSSISSSSSDSAVVTVIEMRNDVRREFSGGWSTRRDNDTRISKFTKSCLYVSFMSYNEDLVLEVIRSGEGYYHAYPCIPLLPFFDSSLIGPSHCSAVSRYTTPIIRHTSGVRIESPCACASFTDSAQGGIGIYLIQGTVYNSVPDLVLFK